MEKNNEGKNGVFQNAPKAIGVVGNLDGIQSDDSMKESKTICNKVNKEFQFWDDILNGKSNTTVFYDCDDNYDVKLDATKQE